MLIPFVVFILLGCGTAPLLLIAGGRSCLAMYRFEQMNITLDTLDFSVENAFCVSNERIAICGGMIKLVTSEDELAAIVMHEKAHLVLKHGEKAWYEKVGGWFTGWFTDESKPRFRGPPDPKSVARENEADAKGLMLMAEAGCDPQAAVSFWTRYYERTGWWEGDGTHPKPRERLAHLNALMPKAKELYRVANNKKQKESAK